MDARLYTHDLRAPLRHVDSFAHLLLKRVENELDETSQHYLDNILDSTERMGRLIDDLLALSRTGRAQMHLRKLDLNAIIEDVRQELISEAGERDIVWTVAALPPVQADQGLIRIVLMNLLGNAVKYTQPREHATIEIGVFLPAEDNSSRRIQNQLSKHQSVLNTPASSEDRITFFVRDNGVGFDPQYTNKLFGVFQRLHQKDQFEGAGIGLATVRGIIHRHGGKVWAEGEVDQGATFYFTLPIQ